MENDNDQEGYIEANGKEAFGGLRFAETFSFGDDGLTVVSEPGSSRYILNKDGTTIFKDAAIEDISIISDNQFLVTQNGKQGIVDKNNKAMLPIVYNIIVPISKNLLLVLKDSIRYYTDYNGLKVAAYTEQ